MGSLSADADDTTGDGNDLCWVSQNFLSSWNVEKLGMGNKEKMCVDMGEGEGERKEGGVE